MIEVHAHISGTGNPFRSNLVDIMAVGHVVLELGCFIHSVKRRGLFIVIAEGYKPGDIAIVHGPDKTIDSLFYIARGSRAAVYIVTVKDNEIRLLIVANRFNQCNCS